jgi:RNA recognition motif-containing protein
MTALQSNALASGKKMLAEGFNAMRESIHHVKVLQEMVSQLNLQGQSDDMAWGKEMLADSFHAMEKVTRHVKVLHAMIRPLKIQESDAITKGKEMLEDGFKALQKARLHVKELEEIVHQMNMLEQYAMQNPALPVHTEVDPVSVNKKRTFSQQDGEQFINQVLAMGETNSAACEHSEKRAMYALNTQSFDDHKETQSPLCEPTHTIVIKCFPRSITESELCEYFRSYGVCDIDLPIHNDPNNPRYGTIRGFAFIHYETAEQSDRAFHALSTSGLFIDGKKVKAKVSKYNKALRGTTLSPNCKPADITERDLPINKETDVNPESVPVSVEPLSSMVPETPCSHGIKTIIARNLPRMISEEILCDLFQLYGVVRDVHLPRNKDPDSRYYGTIRGFALIRYETAAQSARAVRVLTTLGLSICGKEVTVEFATSDT